MAEDLVSSLTELCVEHRLVAMYAFGSRAQEVAARVEGREARAAHPSSDIDIGVLPRRDHRLAAAERVRLMQRLETLLGVPRVDVDDCCYVSLIQINILSLHKNE